MAGPFEPNKSKELPKCNPFLPHQNAWLAICNWMQKSQPNVAPFQVLNWNKRSYFLAIKKRSIIQEEKIPLANSESPTTQRARAQLLNL